MRATKVDAGLAESNGRLLLGIWRDSLHATCGLTACTPGSAPGPTLGNEYGKTLPFFKVRYALCSLQRCILCYSYAVSPCERNEALTLNKHFILIDSLSAVKNADFKFMVINQQIKFSSFAGSRLCKQCQGRVVRFTHAQLTLCVENPTSGTSGVS